MNTKEIRTPIKAIRAKCIDCCCFQPKEVRLCTAVNCPLHPFRFGKNPYRKVREMNDEERQSCAERLASGRAKMSL